jgi:hypothetical protein
MHIGAVYARTEAVCLCGRSREMLCVILRGITLDLVTAALNGECVHLKEHGHSC